VTARLPHCRCSAYGSVQVYVVKLPLASHAESQRCRCAWAPRPFGVRAVAEGDDCDRQSARLPIPEKHHGVGIEDCQELSGAVRMGRLAQREIPSGHVVECRQGQVGLQLQRMRKPYKVVQAKASPRPPRPGSISPLTISRRADPKHFRLEEHADENKNRNKASIEHRKRDNAKSATEKEYGCGGNSKVMGQAPVPGIAPPIGELGSRIPECWLPETAESAAGPSVAPDSATAPGINLPCRKSQVREKAGFYGQVEIHEPVRQ